MESSPDDVPMSLRFEPETVVVFNFYVRLGTSLGLVCCAGFTPSPQDPFVRLMSVQFASARNRGNVRRCGAQPNTAQFRPESKRCPNCLGYHPGFFQSGTLFRPLPCIIVVTLVGCFCERVNLVISLDLLPLLSRSRLVKVPVRFDPSDLFHVWPVRATVG